jgi:hypothetical protein
VEQPAFAGRQAHNDGKLDAWPLLNKLIEHCATPTAAKVLVSTSPELQTQDSISTFVLYSSFTTTIFTCKEH